MTALDGASVRRVRAVLELAGSPAQVVELAATARTARDAAAALGVEVGAIVKSLVFLAGGQPVMALVAGDRQCDPAALVAVLGLEGPPDRAAADLVREATGFAIGGVAPVGHPEPLPTAIDASLGRFGTVYAAAGHPHCVFGTSLDELQRLTGGTVSDRLGKAAP
jgi:prolyl-tRNA editing enzyme YbaK/EbsC (Cys-tRNA(Pro) deacylase)